MPGPETDRLAAAVAATLTDPGDLSAWGRGEPGAEAQPHKQYRRFLLRAGWPNRVVTVGHRKRPGHRAVDQAVTVVPLVMLGRLAAALGWPVERLCRDVME